MIVTNLFPRRRERQNLADYLPSVHFGRIRCRFAPADQLEMRLAETRGPAAKFTPPFLSRAFAGQLVPHNPNDGPAEELVRRIQIKCEDSVKSL